MSPSTPKDHSTQDPGSMEVSQRRTPQHSAALLGHSLKDKINQRSLVCNSSSRRSPPLPLHPNPKGQLTDFSEVTDYHPLDLRCFCLFSGMTGLLPFRQPQLLAPAQGRRVRGKCHPLGNDLRGSMSLPTSLYGLEYPSPPHQLFSHVRQ